MPRLTQAAPKRVSILEAKYSGRCITCGGEIPKGERLVWVGRGSIYHPDPKCIPANVLAGMGLLPVVDGPGMREAELAADGPEPAAPSAPQAEEQPAGEVLSLRESMERFDAKLKADAEAAAESVTGLAMPKVVKDKPETAAPGLESNARSYPVDPEYQPDGSAEAKLEAIARMLGAQSKAPDVRAQVLEVLESLAPTQVQTAAQAAASLPPVPPLSPLYVQSAMGELIRHCLQSGRHFAVSGPSGSGKTYPIEQECARLGIRVIKVGCSAGTSYEALFVRQALEVDPATGATITVWRYGATPLAMRIAACLILDEVDQLDPVLGAAYHPILESDGRGELYLPETGERIKPAPGFVIACTSNMLRDSTGLYAGHRLSAAFTNRLAGIRGDYLEPAQEKDILQRAGADAALAGALVAWLGFVRDLYLKGDLTQAPSTRVAVDIVRMVNGVNRDGSNGLTPLPLRAALELAYLNLLSPDESAKAQGCASQAGVV